MNKVGPEPCLDSPQHCCPNEVAMRRVAKCALELGVRLKLNPDGSVEVLGQFVALADAHAEAAVSARLERALPRDECSRAPVEPIERSPATLIEPPLRGRRLRQECWSLTETAYELAVSRWTLWRAARSDLPDFPEPIVISRRLYWRKRDLERLEAAMMFFEGRCAFDRKRKAARTDL